MDCTTSTRRLVQQETTVCFGEDFNTTHQVCVMDDELSRSCAHEIQQKEGSSNHEDIKSLLREGTTQVLPEDQSNTVSRGQMYPLKKIDILAILFSVSFYLFDLITDILLAFEYFRVHRQWEFVFTVIFIIVPSVTSSILSCMWYIQDEHTGSSRKALWYLRIFAFSIPPFAPVFRNLMYIYHGVKSQSKRLSEDEKHYHYKEMLYGDRDASMIRMIDAFMESAPQLVLQIYIMGTEVNQDEYYLKIIRYAAIMASWIGVSWSVTAYHRALRISNATSEFYEGSLIAAAWYFMWRAFEVGPRVIVLGLTASLFLIYVLSAAGCHWILMIIWLIYQNPDIYKEQRKQKYVLIAAVGFAQMFSFMNVKNTPTRLRSFIFYCIFYAENFAAFVLWIVFKNDLINWMFYTGSVMVIVGFAMQVVFQMSYYHYCHPKRKQIVLCLGSEKI